ncbi:MAG: AAA family ATPase [Pseudomonadota bacterium]
MHITELRIAGFKSFVDPETVPIEPGLTGIVGPNGCGKSNLLEALRWAMGATSARAMRGGEMDDLIFNGAAGRPARELAEVTLVLDNAARQAPAEFNQSDSLEIIRRLKRGAGSTYKLNGRTVRAKDVQLVFADASTGANSPSLVRQGQINELIASKPQNRRRILEEAAGVSGLSARRHEAELKLKAAELNLTSLSDLTAEIERQLESLKRQARKASKYRSLSQELQAVEAFLLHLKWDAAREAFEAASLALRAAEHDVQSSTRQAAVLETQQLKLSEQTAPLKSEESTASAKVGQMRIELARVETEREGALERLANLRDDSARLSDEISNQKEQKVDAETQLIETKSRLAVLPSFEDNENTELARLAEDKLSSARQVLATAQSAADTSAQHLANDLARRKAAGAQLSSLQQRRAQLNSELDRYTEELKGLQEHQSDERFLAALADETDARIGLEKARQTFASAEENLEARRSARASLKGPFESLRDEMSAIQSETAGLERLLRKADLGRAQPVMSQMKIAVGYEKAVGAVIGDDLAASSDPSAELYWAGAGAPDQLLPIGCDQLSKFVEAPAVLEARLTQCGVCLPQHGAELASLLRPGQRLVSQEGHLWRWDGFTKTPDAPSSAAERLEQQTRLEVNQKRLSTLEIEFEVAKTAFNHAEQAASDAEVGLKGEQAELNRASERALRSANLLAKLRADQESLSSRIETHTKQIQHLEADTEQLDVMIRDATQHHDASSNQELETAAEVAQIELQRARAAETEARGELADLTRNRAQALARRKAVEEDLDRWTRLVQKTSDRLKGLETQFEARQKAVETAERQPADLELRHAAIMTKLETAEKERRTATDALAEMEKQVRDAERSLRNANSAAMNARERFAEQKAIRDSSDRLIADLTERSTAQFQSAPHGLLQISARNIEPDTLRGMTLQDAESRITEIRFERERLGGVNMEAESEAVALEERLNTQELEQADLSEAIDKLRQGIAELNSEARQRLVEAFEAVNGHFKSLFKTLFRGGEAELRLVDAEDPLDAGLEIFAQPPGKRLGTLSLMSGGEQALTAAALIFAVFLSRPAPICVLDEVDAPLDDANVDRFCRLLKEMRQRTNTRFVVITHNPVTMSRMDRLFGVTMREQGVSKLVSVDLNAAEALVAAE